MNKLKLKNYILTLFLMFINFFSMENNVNQRKHGNNKKKLNPSSIPFTFKTFFYNKPDFQRKFFPDYIYQPKPSEERRKKERSIYFLCWTISNFEKLIKKKELLFAFKKILKKKIEYKEPEELKADSIKLKNEIQIKNIETNFRKLIEKVLDQNKKELFFNLKDAVKKYKEYRAEIERKKNKESKLEIIENIRESTFENKKSLKKNGIREDRYIAKNNFDFDKLKLNLSLVDLAIAYSNELLNQNEIIKLDQTIGLIGINKFKKGIEEIRKNEIDKIKEKEKFNKKRDAFFEICNEIYRSLPKKIQYKKDNLFIQKYISIDSKEDTKNNLCFTIIIYDDENREEDKAYKLEIISIEILYAYCFRNYSALNNIVREELLKKKKISLTEIEDNFFEDIFESMYFSFEGEDIRNFIGEKKEQELIKFIIAEKNNPLGLKFYFLSMKYGFNDQELLENLRIIALNNEFKEKKTLENYFEKKKLEEKMEEENEFRREFNINELEKNPFDSHLIISFFEGANSKELNKKLDKKYGLIGANKYKKLIEIINKRYMFFRICKNIDKSIPKEVKIENNESYEEKITKKKIPIKFITDFKDPNFGTFILINKNKKNRELDISVIDIMYVYCFEDYLYLKDIIKKEMLAEEYFNYLKNIFQEIIISFEGIDIKAFKQDNKIDELLDFLFLKKENIYTNFEIFFLCMKYRFTIKPFKKIIENVQIKKLLKEISFNKKKMEDLMELKIQAENKMKNKIKSIIE